MFLYKYEYVYCVQQKHVNMRI